MKTNKKLSDKEKTSRNKRAILSVLDHASFKEIRTACNSLSADITKKINAERKIKTLKEELAEAERTIKQVKRK